MALSEFTKQLAQQALLTATKEPVKEPAAAAPDDIGSVIFAQIHAMQKALKEGEELALTFQHGAERIRVLEIYMPSRRVAVLGGIDQERAFVRVVSPVESLQLASRVVKAQHGAKPARVALIAPKT
ncbi:MAG: hypothetical protein ABSC23_09365 [Bryobacteraceae bacterium]|jgi:hypothetical protein